jgi:hypothetical protein
MTLAEFRALHAEYDRAGDALVQNALDEAELLSPSDVWGDFQAQGIRWEAAFILSVTPGSRDMAVGVKQDENPYKLMRARLVRIVSCGYRVCGIPEGLE